MSSPTIVGSHIGNIDVVSVGSKRTSNIITILSKHTRVSDTLYRVEHAYENRLEVFASFFFVSPHTTKVHIPIYIHPRKEGSQAFLKLKTITFKRFLCDPVMVGSVTDQESSHLKG